MRWREHNRIRNFIYYLYVDLFSCIYVLMQVSTVDNVDQTSRTLLEKTQQWVDLGLASDAPHRKPSSPHAARFPPKSRSFEGHQVSALIEDRGLINCIHLQWQTSACGCAPVHGNIDHDWSTQARAVEHKARPVDRPGHPGGWSARWPQASESRSLRENNSRARTSRACQETTASEMQICDPSRRECMPKSPRKTTSLTTESARDSTSSTGSSESYGKPRDEEGVDCALVSGKGPHAE